MTFYHFSSNFSGFKLHEIVLIWQIQIVAYMKLIQDAHLPGAKGVKILPLAQK